MTRIATMLGRHVYRVRPIEQGWGVQKDGEAELRARCTGRGEAIAEAERLSSTRATALSPRSGCLASISLTSWVVESADPLSPR